MPKLFAGAFTLMIIMPAAFAAKQKAHASSEMPDPTLELPALPTKSSQSDINVSLLPTNLNRDLRALPSAAPAHIPPLTGAIACTNAEDKSVPEKIEALAKKYYSLVGATSKTDLVAKVAATKELMGYIAAYDPSTCFRGDAQFETLCLQLQNPDIKIDPSQPMLLPGTIPNLRFQRVGGDSRNIWKIFYKGEAIGRIVDDNHDGFLDTIELAKPKGEISDLPGAAARVPGDARATFLHGDLAGKINLDSSEERCLGAGLNPAKFYASIMAASEKALLATKGPALKNQMGLLRFALWDSFLRREDRGN